MKFEPDIEKVYELRAEADQWPDSWHRFEQEHVYAIQAAIACQRPLLVRGEPGVGKTQLARAAAAVIKTPFLSYTMTAHTECGDLLYEFDAVARLAQAQVLGHVGGKNWRKDLAMERFVRPGHFWWALDWGSAMEQCARYTGDEKGVAELLPARIPNGWRQQTGCVLLVDEIDKAEGDVPNALLESFGAFTFAVPEARVRVGLPEKHAPPLLVITTNEERELPRAFVRRCLVLQMDFSREVMIRRGQDRFEKRIAETVYEAAAEQLMKDRVAAAGFGPVRPGVAEYLDLLRILAEETDPTSQMKRLEQVHNLVGAKNPGQHVRKS